MPKDQKPKAKPFGGMAYDFSNEKITLAELFGKKIGPTDMMKKVFEYIRTHQVPKVQA